jgi:hypothetical protein
MTKTIKDFQVGDLVRYFDTYAYSDIVKDSGLGVIIRIQRVQEWDIFVVYSNKKQTVSSYSYNDLEYLKE